MCESNEPLLLPWLIRTYRDLFRNVGYELEAEEILRGSKNGVHFEVLISLFAKGPRAGPEWQVSHQPEDHPSLQPHDPPVAPVPSGLGHSMLAVEVGLYVVFAPGPSYNRSRSPPRSREKLAE
jgi:hypothetical protein